MKKGFTLIELLVVIAVIGILATVVIVNVSKSRGRANDSKIVNDYSAATRIAIQCESEGRSVVANAEEQYGWGYGGPICPGGPTGDWPYYPNSLRSSNGGNWFQNVGGEPSVNDSFNYITANTDLAFSNYAVYCNKNGCKKMQQQPVVGGMYNATVTW